MYLAVTCHLHFWQNDQDILCATVITRGWNRYWNKSQHRKLTLEKKILLLLKQGLKPAILQSQAQRSIHWAIPTPSILFLFFWCTLSGTWMSTETLGFGGNVPVSYATPGRLWHWQPPEALVGRSALQVHLDAGSLTVWYACWIWASILMSPGSVAAIAIIAPRGLMVAVLLLELPGKNSGFQAAKS